jgi:hypothetical protein
MRLIVSVFVGLVGGLFSSWSSLILASWVEGKLFGAIPGCADREDCPPGSMELFLLALTAPVVFHVICFARVRAKLGFNVRTVATFFALWGCTAIWLVAVPVLQITLSK